MSNRRLWLVLVTCWSIVVVPLSRRLVAEDNADPLVDMVVGLLSEKDKDMRSVGLEQVRSEAKGPQATRKFAAQLPKLPPDAQAGLLSALGDRKDPAARPSVLEMLDSTKDPAVKAAAIGALAHSGTKRTCPACQPCCCHRSKANPAQRATAWCACGAMRCRRL